MPSLRSFDPHLLIDRPSLSGEPSPRMMGHGSRGSRASLDASARLVPFARDPVPPEHMPGQSLPQGLAAGLSRLHLQPSQKSPIPTPGTTPGATFSAGLDMWSSSGRSANTNMGMNTGMGMSWEHRSLSQGLAAGQLTPSGSASGLGSGMHTPSGSWREAHSPSLGAWGGRDSTSGGMGGRESSAWGGRDSGGRGGRDSTGLGELSLSYSMPRGLGMGLAGSTQTTPSKGGAQFAGAERGNGVHGLGGGGQGLGRGRRGFGEDEDIFDLDLEPAGEGR